MGRTLNFLALRRHCKELTVSMLYKLTMLALAVNKLISGNYYSIGQ